jgi:hypothetical protein
MTWLDEQIQKAEELKRAEALMDEHAPKLYETLWNEMNKIAVEATSKGIAVYGDGSVTSRTLRLGVPPQPSHSSVTLNLSKNKREIKTVGTVGVSFDVAICDDGIVCLKQNDGPISFENAARQIMGPFLLPELYTISKP